MTPITDRYWVGAVPNQNPKPRLFSPARTTCGIPKKSAPECGVRCAGLACVLDPFLDLRVSRNVSRDWISDKGESHAPLRADVVEPWAVALEIGCMRFPIAMLSPYVGSMETRDIVVGMRVQE